MSHREMDHASDLHRRLKALDERIADTKASGLVDMRAFADLRRARAALAAQLTDIEAEKTWP